MKTEKTARGWRGNRVLGPVAAVCVASGLVLASLHLPADAARKIGSSGIVNKAIKTRHLAPGAVKAKKIAPAAVKTGKIANGAVTGPKLGNGAVTGAKVANGSLTKANLGYEMVLGSVVTLNEQDDKFAHAACPAGKVPVGGGYITVDNSNSNRLFVKKSGFNLNTSWEVRVWNDGAAQRKIRAQVFCLQLR